MRHQLENQVERCLRAAGISPEQQVLLALSGGRDSVVLGEVLHRLEQRFAVAHVNYRLRGEASEGDARWAAQLAASWGVAFHLEETHRTALGANVQQGARELRYAWMRDLCAANGYHAVLTAHHLADQAETFLLAAFKGRGSRALAGMRMVNDSIIRPLLTTHEQEIASYAATHALEWREDASNDQLNYDRNFIRHEVLPLIVQRFPEAKALLAREAARLQQLEALAAEQLAHWKARMVEEIDAHFHRWNLAGLPPMYASWVLGRMCAEMGLEQGAIDAVIGLCEKPVGKKTAAAGWTIVRTRQGLDWFRDLTITEVNLQVSGPGLYVLPQGTLQVVRQKQADPTAAFCLPAAYVSHQLQLRHWKKGDAMALQVQGRKKISDLLQEQQINYRDRLNTLVLAQADDVFWVIGLRKRTFDVPVASANDWWVFNWIT